MLVCSGAYPVSGCPFLFRKGRTARPKANPDSKDKDCSMRICTIFLGCLLVLSPYSQAYGQIPEETETTGLYSEMKERVETGLGSTAEFTGNTVKKVLGEGGDLLEPDMNIPCMASYTAAKKRRRTVLCENRKRLRGQSGKPPDHPACSLP